MYRVLRYLFIPLRFVFNYILKKLKLFVIYRHDTAVGDHVCMTGIVNLLHTQYGRRSFVFTDYPTLFKNNPHVGGVFSFRRFTGFVNTIVLGLLSMVRDGHTEIFHLRHPKYNYEEFMKATEAKIHLARAHSMHFKFRLLYTGFTNEIILTDEECVFYRKKYNLPPRFAIVQPVGKTSFTPNKEWGFNKFQKVISSLKGVRWIQAGLAGDPLLRGVIDFRGKTGDIRELAYIVSRSDFVLCLEGVYNHLSAAFSVPAFVIFSGFAPLELALYKNTIPISLVPQVPCSPCWLRTPCPVPGKPCTEKITPAKVRDKILLTIDM
jgi:hypothetical protein